ncbi:hypothetical protein DL764_000452 [Monosporascus ibericus]|uniref:Alpha-glucosidase N-terminal domain-containing protein n=1 Tax=Monosporascus ibericus TaxID=155417 RepID=A0A4Q4TTD7_9PEZI|nr:hypothetical protein DL764_000452 [Monosporascus ibericus]
MEKYKFPTEPVADSAATVIGPNYRFTFLSDLVLRYEWSHDGVFEDRASCFAINRKFPPPQFKVEGTENQLVIRSSSFYLTYDKQRFSPNGLHVNFAGKTTLWGAEWRYGGPPDTRNLGGTTRTLDGVDGRCDVGSGILSKSGYADVDDSESMLFDGKGFVAPRRPSDRIDGYLFCYGQDYKAVMKEYLELMDKFAEQSVPLSVAVIDMDWHLVNDPRVPHTGWTGYTWNRKLFRDPDAFCKALHDRKLKITLNDHPHAGVHSHEDQYEEMAKFLGHDTTHKAPILFEATSQKYMYAYFNILHRSLEKNSCDFWWIDWQQGTYSAIPGIDPLWVLNHFQYLDSDSVTTWASLEFQPEFTAMASNIGYGWWSHDISGHMMGYRDDELSARWVQLGAFSPVLRLHSTNSPWNSKEPWRYRKESEESIKHFMQLRHRFVPYIYTMNVLSASCGEPLVQPLYWAHPGREEAYQKPNEYFFGSSLLVAPIVRPRDRRTNHAAVDVWVPPSRHVDIFTGLVYDGDREITMYRTLNHIPILAAEGSIIPLDRDTCPANGCANPEGFEVLIVVGQNGQFNIIEDTSYDNVKSGSTATNVDRTIGITFEQSSGKLQTSSHGRVWRFKFVSLMTVPPSLSVVVDGAQVDAKITVEEYPEVPGLVIEIPKCSNSDAPIEVTLGEDQQLSAVDAVERVKDLLLDFQIEYSIKDKVLEIIQSCQPVLIWVSRLTALALEEPVIGPILELLMADRRQL